MKLSKFWVFFALFLGLLAKKKSKERSRRMWKEFLESLIAHAPLSQSQLESQLQLQVTVTEWQSQSQLHRVAVAVDVAAERNAHANASNWTEASVEQSAPASTRSVVATEAAAAAAAANPKCQAAQASKRAQQQCWGDPNSGELQTKCSRGRQSRRRRTTMRSGCDSRSTLGPRARLTGCARSGRAHEGGRSACGWLGVWRWVAATVERTQPTRLLDVLHVVSVLVVTGQQCCQREGATCCCEQVRVARAAWARALPVYRCPDTCCAAQQAVRMLQAVQQAVYSFKQILKLQRSIAGEPHMILSCGFLHSLNTFFF